MSKDGNLDLAAWTAEGSGCLVDSLRAFFVTGNWGNNNSDNDSNKTGNFKDLKTGENFDALRHAKEARALCDRKEFGNGNNTANYCGLVQGTYVRVRVDGVHAAFVQSFDLRRPAVLGSLTPQETV